MEIIIETIIGNSKGAAKVFSKEEGDVVSMVALDNLDGLLFKGSSTAMFVFLFSTTNYKTIPANLTVFSPPIDKKMCCPGSALVLKPKMDAI